MKPPSLPLSELGIFQSFAVSWKLAQVVSILAIAVQTNYFNIDAVSDFPVFAV
jgi:hypothetical protein